eukprot:jgi/Bigna1/141503/aug1.63_g16211
MGEGSDMWLFVRKIGELDGKEEDSSYFQGFEQLDEGLGDLKSKIEQLRLQLHDVENRHDGGETTGNTNIHPASMYHQLPAVGRQEVDSDLKEGSSRMPPNDTWKRPTNEEHPIQSSSPPSIKYVTLDNFGHQKGRLERARSRIRKLEHEVSHKDFIIMTLKRELLLSKKKILQTSLDKANEIIRTVVTSKLNKDKKIRRKMITAPPSDVVNGRTGNSIAVTRNSTKK